MGIINRIGGHGVSLAKLKAAVVAIGPSMLLDADSIAGSDGDAIGTWSDDSGNGVNFAQSNASYKPLLKKGANGINGHNVVRFDGVDNMLSSTDSGKVLGDVITNSTDNCFFVFKLVAVTTDVDPMYDNDFLISDEGGVWGLYFKTDGYMYCYYYPSSSVSTKRAISTGVAYIAASRHSGGSIYLSLNNGSEDSASCGNVVVTEPLFIGGYGSVFTRIDVAEIICFKSNLSAGNRAIVINYLKTKYATY